MVRVCALSISSSLAGAVKAKEGEESGDAAEGGKERRGSRQRRLDEKLSTCPDIGRALPMEKQSVEAQGTVRKASLACCVLRIERLAFLDGLIYVHGYGSLYESYWCL